MSVNGTIMYGINGGRIGECFVITAMDEQDAITDLAIRPNPSTGQFTLHNPRLAKNIAVYPSSGQKIWQGSGNTIDITAQPPGVYTAVVATERGRQAVRLVVMR